LVNVISATNTSLKKYGPGVMLIDISSPLASTRTVVGAPTGPAVVVCDRFVKSTIDAPISRPTTRTAAICFQVRYAEM
jgi:hypothetical protein